MKFYVGVTDNNWFRFLSQRNPEDVNFWQPSGSPFKVINPGAPFLMKLKRPNNVIAGVGFFFRHTLLPLTVAWETFGQRNGCELFTDFQRMILNYRSDRSNTNPLIGCVVLTNPIFFREEDWIPAPSDWSNSIVRGKSYSTEESIGNYIWNKVEETLTKYSFFQQTSNVEVDFAIKESESPHYGTVLTKVRIGQGAFRVGVIEAYHRKCSISGEKTLPVLEAAHIQPYSFSGINAVSNGILMRSDIHKLFDSGYITITPDFTIEISRRIKEEFENGKEYYQHHGKRLIYLPENELERPNPLKLEWHNSHVYKG